MSSVYAVRESPEYLLSVGYFDASEEEQKAMIEDLMAEHAERKTHIAGNTGRYDPKLTDTEMLAGAPIPDSLWHPDDVEILTLKGS